MWVSCPGGVPFIEAHSETLQALGRPESSEAAAQGTLAHEYSENRILAQFHPDVPARKAHSDRASDLKPQLQKEIKANADRYVTWVSEYIMTAPLKGRWGVELSAPLWYEPESKGTADFWAIEDDTLVVIDYKSGRIPVHVDGNLQIAIYLIAIWDEVRRFHPTIRNFRAGVHQPFADPEPRFWEFDLVALETYRSQLSVAAREVDNPFLGYHALTVTEKGCRFCPAKPICPAQAQRTELALNMIEEDPQALDGDTLFTLFRQIKQIRGFLTEVEDYVRDQSDEILTTNGFTRKDGSRRFNWRDEEEAIARLVMLGADPFTEPKLKTPAMVRSELTKKEVESLDEIIETEYNRPSIVPIAESKKTFRARKSEGKK